MDENEISNIVIGRGLKVHTALGPGLLESSYAACLNYELVVADYLSKLKSHCR